ncbi:adenylate/guanylate cyclase domain-containing protein [Malaciobacter sp. WC5094]
MNTVKKVVSILFSDIKGYSKVTDDHLKELVAHEFKKIQSKILNKENHFYQNTWGDALLVCSYDYFDLANIALNLRDEFKKTNWKRLGLPELAIRVGLHTQKISLIIDDNGRVSDISGSGVDTTARIEPIVEPNKVYASNLFCEHLKEENNLNINISALGKKQLAKNYKEMNLFELTWGFEEVGTVNTQLVEPSLDIPIPKIKKEFTDIEKKEFLKSSFNHVVKYFNQASIQLKEKYPKIKVEINEVSSSKFVCSLYVNDEEKQKCKIWFSENDNNFFGTNQISYSEGYFDIDNDNSTNDWLNIEDDGFKLYFSKPMMYFGNFNDEIQNKEKWNANDSAKYLWVRFIEQLKHIYI